MSATIKQTVTISQENPPVTIKVECPDEKSAKRVAALDDGLLSKINMAVQGFHQPDIPELQDKDRNKGGGKGK